MTEEQKELDFTARPTPRERVFYAPFGASTLFCGACGAALVTTGNVSPGGGTLDVKCIVPRCIQRGQMLRVQLQLAEFAFVEPDEKNAT